MCTTAIKDAFAGAIAVILLASIGCGSPDQPSMPAADWGYTGDIGPTRWATISPSYAACGSGQMQSPIDLESPKMDGAGDLILDYGIKASQLANNGHTLQVNFPGGDILHVGQTPYELQQFHLHVPSEHLIDGVPGRAELHLVHKSADGNLAVVGIILQQGATNDAIGRMLAAAVGKDQTVSTAQPFDAAALIPAGEGYYMYNGSLTTPPCTEGVLWMILNKPGEIDDTQVAQFQSQFGANARPAQALNGRSTDEYSSL